MDAFTQVGSRHCGRRRPASRARETSGSGAGFSRRLRSDGFAAIALVSLGLAFGGAYAQSDNSALVSWGDTIGHRLLELLPKPASGLTAANETVFSAFSYNFIGYKGPKAIAERYPTYVVHQAWVFDEPELERRLATLRADNKARQDEFPRKLEEFQRTHAADKQAAEQAYQQEHAQAVKDMNARMAKMNELIKEGKYAEIGKLGDAPPNMGPFIYKPEQAFVEANEADLRDRDQRLRQLEGTHRRVEFWIYTNRTPLSSPGRRPKPAGTLAGHPLFREDQGRLTGSELQYVNLGVLVGPPDVEVSQPPGTPYAVKAIAVWGMLITRDDVAAGDEERVRRILEAVDYPGLTKLLAR